MQVFFTMTGMSPIWIIAIQDLAVFHTLHSSITGEA
jgi:hypothetical protein